MALKVIKKLKLLFSGQKKTAAKPGNKTLMEWQEMYKDLQSHPLTQAKIINEQLLETTNDSLKRIEKRIDKIEDRVEDLEKEEPKPAPAPKTRKRTSKSEPKEKMPKEIVKVKKIVAEANLSDQERSIVKHLEEQSESDADSIAQQFNISRSNASLKLNKLHKWGFLDKHMEGKTVFYNIKD